MENKEKVTNIIHPGAGRRSIAALIDFGIITAVGMGLFFLLSYFVFEPISRAVPTVDYVAFEASAQRLMDTQVASGLFYYDDETEKTEIYASKATYQEYDAIIQNYYFVYLQTPDLIDDELAATYTPYWYNVFIYGLDDEQNLYSDSDLAKRYSVVDSVGKTYFEYDVVGEVKQYDALAVVKTSHYKNSDREQGLTDDAKTGLLNYFYNGNLSYAYTGVASIYVLTIEADLATRTFFADAYTEYREFAYQVSIWTTLLPELTAILIVAVLAYFVMPLILKNGKTVGKLVMGIALVNKLGYNISIPQLVMRFFFPLVVVIGLLIVGGSTFAIGMGLFVLVSYTMVIFTKEHKAIHDYLAGTIAIDSKRSVWFKDATEEAKYVDKINAMPELHLDKPENEIIENEEK